VAWAQSAMASFFSASDESPVPADASLSMVFRSSPCLLEPTLLVFPEEEISLGEIELIQVELDHCDFVLRMAPYRSLQTTDRRENGPLTLSGCLVARSLPPGQLAPQFSLRPAITQIK